MGPSGRLLAMLDEGSFTLFVSPEGLAEYEDVLSRRAIRRKNPHLTDTVAAALMERIRDFGTLLAHVPGHFTYRRDPDDEHVVNLAVEAGARYVVSRDKDLLDLMDDTRPDGRAFRERFPDLRVLDPVNFIRVLSPPTDSAPEAAPPRQDKPPDPSG